MSFKLLQLEMIHNRSDGVDMMTKVLLKKKLQVSIEVAGMMVPHPHKLERVICWKILLMMWAKDEKNAHCEQSHI